MNPSVNLYDPLPPDGTDLNARDRDQLPKVERHLLACCLRGDADDPGIDDAAEILTPDDFAIPGHRAVFAAALALRGAGGAVLAADVFESLARRDAASPGSAGLGDLRPRPGVWLAETVELEPTGGRARYYARLVRDASLLRQLRGAVAEMLRDATNPSGPAVEVIGRCEKLLFELSDSTGPKRDATVSAAEVVLAALQRIDERVAGGLPPGVVTGYPDLDDVLGDLRGGQMIVIGARPGGGKTSLAACIAANVATAGKGALFFSMEMPADQIGERLVAMGSGIALNRVSRGRSFSAEDIERLASVAGAGGLGTVPVHIDDTPDQPAARLMAVARREIRRRNVGIVVVDYLQLMRPENSDENRTQQVGLMARRVKQLARECNVPVLCLCQLNRQVENRGGDHKPRLSDLRESGEIEAHADAVLLLAPQPDQAKGNDVWMIDVVVGKNRNGPTGDVTLAYRRSVVRFESAARRFGAAGGRHDGEAA